MFSKVAVLTCLLAGILFSQVWLDPTSFPNAKGPCTPSQQMLDDYQAHYRGTLTYGIRTTPPDLARPGKYLTPVIDGILEDSIWTYAETLLVNSWEDAGAAAACGNPKSFLGPEDLHAIWRFCYNHDGLYVGVEMHDDVHDVDSLQGWYMQDGIQMCLDPSDWGDYAAGMWSASTNTFRRYYSNAGTVIPYSDNSQTAYIMLLKRMNEEPYLTGLIRANFKANYGRGQEASNFRNGDYGIEFAAKSQGTDPWFRSVWHMEFKFPYHGELWDALEGRGFFDAAGLPKQGNLFKMDFYNNDDDIVGPNGSKGGVKALFRRREMPFSQEASGHDHWSDTKYGMVMKYDGNAVTPVVTPYFGGAPHGDRRISRVWVDAATEQDRYSFTADGTVKLDSVNYFFDTTSAAGGKISTRTDSVGSYVFVRFPGNKPLKDTLKLTFNGSTRILIPELVTGYSQVEGRWVQARLTVTPDSRCGGTDTSWQPVVGAKEFRFSPLSKLRLDQATYPSYHRCFDSLRIYDFATQTLEKNYTYTYDKAILGRDSVYFTYQFTTLWHETDPRALRNLILTYSKTGLQDTLVWYDAYPLTRFGESGANMNQSFITYSALAQGVRQVWRLRVMDKYSNNVRIYPDSMTKTVSYQVGLYPDIMMDIDTLSPNFWSKKYPVSFQIDSLQLTGYDSVTGVATGAQSKADTSVFPNGAWVQQVCKVRIEYSAGVNDSFIFKDTTHTFWAMNPDQTVMTVPPLNSVYPWCGDAIEEGAAPSATEMAVTNYPNPFNPSTVVRFTIPGQRAPQRYALNLFNVRGQLVRTLVKGQVGHQGIQKKVVWDGVDNSGLSVGTGVYFYRLTVGDKVRKGTMILVK